MGLAYNSVLASIVERANDSATLTFMQILGRTKAHALLLTKSLSVDEFVLSAENLTGGRLVA